MTACLWCQRKGLFSNFQISVLLITWLFGEVGRLVPVNRLATFVNATDQPKSVRSSCLIEFETSLKLNCLRHCFVFVMPLKQILILYVLIQCNEMWYAEFQTCSIRSGLPKKSIHSMRLGLLSILMKHVSNRSVTRLRAVIRDQHRDRSMPFKAF